MNKWIYWETSSPHTGYAFGEAKSDDDVVGLIFGCGPKAEEAAKMAASAPKLQVENATLKQQLAAYQADNLRLLDLLSDSGKVLK